MTLSPNTFSYFLHSDFLTIRLPDPQKSRNMLLGTAIFATVAVAIGGDATESAAEKVSTTDTLVSFHAKQFKRTQVVKREARCLNLEKSFSTFLKRRLPTSPPGSLGITDSHCFLR